MFPPKWAVYALISAVCWTGAAVVGYHGWQQIQDLQPVPPPQTAVVVAAPTATPTGLTSASPTPTPSPTPPPASVLIQVPFTSQFPYQARNHIYYEDFCEAAATLMIGAFYRGDQRATIPGDEADARMRELVAYERAQFPGQLNLGLAQVAEVAQHFYGLQGSLVPLDLDTIKQDLAAGKPVIIPLMTHPNGVRINPGYGTGSVYHVMLLIGYDSAKNVIYTNDAGLYNGAHLAYSWPILQTAVAAAATTHVDDTRQPVPWQQGQVMLVFSTGS